MTDDLLQKLMEEAGMSYLSDLHTPYQTKAVLSAVHRLFPDDYPLEAWTETVSYILNLEKQQFDSSGSACLFLQNELEKALQKQ